MTDSDMGDSETERPQVNLIGEYCRMCISKWSRCICKPGSDWDENPIYIIMQMDNPSNNDQNDKHPLPLDWSNQENFWNGKEYEKSRTHRPRPYRIPPKMTVTLTGMKIYTQVSPRQPLPGWPKGIRKERLPTPWHTENDPTPNENNNKIQEIEVYYEPMERHSNGLIISCTNMLSKKASDDMD